MSPESNNASPDESVAVLQEKQRLQQAKTFDKWIEGVLKEQRASRRWKIGFRFGLLTLFAISLANTLYLIYLAVPLSDDPVDHLGIVKVEGPIAPNTEANADRVNDGLRRAMADENAKAVVISIDSPGGSPVQSQRIYDEMRHLEGQYPDKPLIALIGDIGASGAYYIASAATEIYSAPSSIVGSIGVISASFGWTELMDKVGVERRVFTAGENKAFMDPYRPLQPDQTEYWQTLLNTTHEQFIADVKAGRGDRLDVENPDLFSGLVWTGAQAKGLGLIDDTKTLEQLAREIVGEVELVDYTPRLGPFDRLAKKVGPFVSAMVGLDYSESPIRMTMP